MSTPTSPSLPIPISPSTAGVGLGYGIAIAVGLLVLISTILLASYLCVKSKSILPSSNSSPLPPPIHQTNSTSPQHFIVGLDLQTIDAFYPKFVYREEEKENGKDDFSGPCPICLGEYEGGDVLRRGPDCGHCFHVKCVDEWLRLSATCPLCRSSPVPSPIATPIATPLAELIPLARTRGR
ncbi:hypothetical protein LUZ60_015564 [Juncus effusus]|nr:hypothetical protein LUZ60_015564 [Juncus effusus]